jgi:hypothetical protein
MSKKKKRQRPTRNKRSPQLRVTTVQAAV